MRMVFLLPFLLVFPGLSFDDQQVRGWVRDSAGAPVAGASVQVVAGGAVLGRVRTGADGGFVWPAEDARGLRIRVSAPGLAAREVVLSSEAVEIRLTPEVVHSSVTVSATPSAREAGEDTWDSPHLAVVATEERLLGRPASTLGHALAEEPGILLQQSTAAQASPFLRGLTGYQVLNLVDGIRFNNSTFRSGPNQYLAYIEPSQAQRIEAVLGPAGVSWGSDSLGGTINVVTARPSFGGDRRRPEVHGHFHLSSGTADLSGAGGGQVSVATARYYWLGGLSGRRQNDLRAGGGVDSRNVFVRLFGLTPEAAGGLVGNRLQDSGFRQYGAQGRFAARLRPDQMLSVNYQRGVQDGVRAYKDLQGGLGRLISTFEPQGLNWLHARYEKLGAGWLDSLSGTVSINSQTDGGRRQNLLYSDPVTNDYARVNVYGYTVQASSHRGSRWNGSFGGELYDERIESRREVWNPVTGMVTRTRPLYPNDSRYRNWGAFAQASYQVSSSLRAAGGVRFTGVQFATPMDANFRIPESSQWFRDVTFQSSLQWQISSVLGLHGVVSRGFRAPNLNDLGALGLNDLGYEVPATEAIGAGALLSTDAGEGAVSKGTALAGLKPESLMNYEFGTRVRAGRFQARAQVFDAELYDPIARRTLLFPAGSVPASVAGLAVTPIAPTGAQRQQGVVTVATSIDPRALKAFVNDGRARYYGVETEGRLLVSRHLALEANYSYTVGRDLFPNRNIRRLPPMAGVARLRYSPGHGRPWVEVSMAASGAQRRLSGGDRDDERIGASFRRADIAAFFRGSTVAGLTDPLNGAFRPTGETLAQIQNRVLPVGAVVNGVRVVDDNTRVPLYLSTAGWAGFHIRSGVPLGERWQLNAALENVLDKNYRYHGSGVDAAGVNAWVGVRFVF